MYNPKPQTRNEIMWAAMAGRDFDLDEKGRFEMFMSDVAERINSGGGGSFVFDLIDNDGELETETTPEDILQAAESGKALIAKVIARTEEEGEVYESIEYYTITSTFVDSGILIECVGLGNIPKYNSTTRQYMMSYIQYHHTFGWQVAQTPCSAQVLQQLGVSTTATMSQKAMYENFASYTGVYTKARELISTAKSNWFTLASQNAGKVCVAGATSNDSAVMSSVEQSIFSLVNRFGFNTPVVDGRYNRAVCRVGGDEAEFIDVETYSLLPCVLTIKITLSQTQAAVQVIGALPIDA